MRHLIIAVLALFAVGCRQTEPVPPAGPLLAPASAPKVYQEYAALAPLFRQQGDTTYLINFWATWCKPCLEELPLLQQLSEETEQRPLQIVLVSLDEDARAIARIPEYLGSRNIDLPTVVLTDDQTGWQKELDKKWDGSLPTSLVYRAGLRYVFRRPFMGMEDVRAAVEPLLGQ